MTLALQMQCSTTELKRHVGANGPSWIRTSVGTNQQIYNLPPLGGQNAGFAFQNWT